MANTNAPAGLIPVRNASGAPYNGSANIYFVPATDATALFVGDPVIDAGDADTNGIPTCTRATAGSAGRITGVVVGVRPTPTITTAYRPASTAAYVYVADDPGVLFEIQASGTLASADIGLNADLVAGAGSTVTGMSGFQLDLSTKATTATLQCRIERAVVREDNVVGANTKVLVRINLPTETGAAGSLGN